MGDGPAGEDSSVKDVLRESGAADLGADLGEAALDALTENEIVKAVPVLGTAVGLVRGGIAVQNALFLRKVRRFLFHADRVPESEKAKFRGKMSRDPEFAAEVGQAAVLAVEKADDLWKASLHGAIFASYLKDEVDLTTLRRLQSAVNAVPAPDLKEFLTAQRLGPVARPGDYVLFAAGMLFPYISDTQNLVPNGDFSGGHMKFYVGRLGEALQAIALRSGIVTRRPPDAK